ncbi:MAG: hypothetical protein ACO1O6_07495 [Bacteroidota bacterium]
MKEELEIGLSGYEFLIFFLYNFVAIAFILVYKTFSTNPLNRYLYPAYFLKVLGGFLFALVYIYYYEGGGDTYYYYVITSDFTDVFYQRPGLFIESYFSGLDYAKEILEKEGYSTELIRDPETFFFMKIQTPLNILSFNSYLGLTFFNSILSLISSFALFNFLTKRVANREFSLFAISFLVPSVLMWGSGILKDTITLTCFNFAVILLYKIVDNGKLKLLPVFVVMLYIIFELKAYILVSFLCWIMFYLFYFFINRSNNPVLKFLIIPYLGIIISMSVYVMSMTILNNTDEYKVDDIYDRIRGFHDFHVYLKGSAYDLGELDYSVWGLLSKFPQAVNVTLFRPYPWEANSLLFFLNSLESFFIFMYFIYLVVKARTLNIFKFFVHDAFMMGAITFCIFYSFVIGVTTYNFGALSRFKIPMVPVFLFCLIYVNYRVGQKNKEKEALLAAKDA